MENDLKLLQMCDVTRRRAADLSVVNTRNQTALHLLARAGRRSCQVSLESKHVIVGAIPCACPTSILLRDAHFF